MEPLKPQERQDLIDLGADPAEVLEYESLLAARFCEDPDLDDAPPAGDPQARSLAVMGLDPASALPFADAVAELKPDPLDRLDELTQKLFPDGIKQG
jgi:hypothetical protein